MIDLLERESYILHILSLNDDGALLICVDETVLEFGGSSSKKHASARAGVHVNATVSDPRFKIGCCVSDTLVERPHLIGEPETDELQREPVARFAKKKEFLKNEIIH